MAKAGRIEVDARSTVHNGENDYFRVKIDYNGSVEESVSMDRNDALDLHYLLSRALGMVK